MRVIKRNGKFEDVSFDKVIRRIRNIAANCGGLNGVELDEIAQKICSHIFDGVKTSELDELTGRLAASMITHHPDYGVLASRIVISNHQKNTLNTFSDKMMLLYHNTECLSNEFYTNLKKYKNQIDKHIDYDRDFSYDYFAFKTLEKAYLLKIKSKIIERPQDMLMRVSLFLHGNTGIDKVLQCYNFLSNKYFIHATPTLFHAGSPKSQLLSCFLIGTEDSIKGIYKTITDCAQISKWAGGIGVHVSNIRASNSLIRGTNGRSDGIIPMLKVYNSTALFVNQSGKRAGSFAIYLETWHADIFEFLDLKKTHGDMEKRALDLFYAMWISDLFMERVEKDEMWSLFSPDEAKGLTDVYGDEFEELYVKYEKEGIARKTVNARKLWNAILTAQIETGTPYLLCKDAANRKTNQKNLGTIKSSNLCVSPETLILTDKGHMEIQELEGQNVNVWNGLEFSNTKVFKTGINQELMEVTFSDGCSLTCTPYHKFYIQEKYIGYKNKKDIINHKNVKTIEAQHLKPDMKLIKCEFPVIDGKEELKYAYTNGFFSGDGTYGNITEHSEVKCSYKSLDEKSFCKRHIKYQKSNEVSEYCKGICYSKKPKVTLYGEKMKLLEHLDYDTCGEINNNKLNVTLKVSLKDKFFVPITGYTIKSKMEWFSGYADADGYICNNQGNCSLQIVSIEKDFLLNIKLMLQTCGINTKISESRPERKSYLPDGKGGHKYYNSKRNWRLLMASNELQKIMALGFNPKRLKIQVSDIQRNATKFITITNTKKLERKADTYCFTESKRHAGIFNGVIASNCAEILEYSDDTEYACCTLSSVGLPKFVEDGKFNYEKLMEVVEIIVDNLNIVIDKNFYPVPETELSNKRHRPLGLGVQGLADTFVLLRYPFDSPEAKQLNNDIFECIYYTALRKSCELSKRDGPYSTFKGSPLSEGKFQFDLWDEELKNISYKRTFEKTKLSDKYDWEGLRKDIMEHGVRNSLLLAMMPTASTGQILGNTECIEPITSNIYTRGTSSGTFVVVNKFLINDLIKENLWSPEMKTRIIRNRGSIQTITEIPLELRKLYKTSWDLKMKVLIDMATDRAKYIDQTQSMNLFIENPTIRKLSSMYFYAYRKGLKTLVYYLRQKSPAFAQQFSVEPVVTNKETFVEEIKEKEEKENTFLKKVFLKEKNKTTTATKSLGKDDEELEAVKQLMCSIKNGPNCESCMG